MLLKGTAAKSPPLRQVSYQAPAPHQMKQHRQDLQPLPGPLRPGEQARAAGKHLHKGRSDIARCAAARVTVPRQPARVRRQHRIDLAKP